jgi:hypothetical protein
MAAARSKRVSLCARIGRLRIPAARFRIMKNQVKRRNNGF